jgi:hypothetical protein
MLYKPDHHYNNDNQHTSINNNTNMTPVASQSVCNNTHTSSQSHAYDHIHESCKRLIESCHHHLVTSDSSDAIYTMHSDDVIQRKFNINVLESELHEFKSESHIYKQAMYLDIAYTSKTSAKYITADQISLPSSLSIQPMTSLLPSIIAATYSQPSDNHLLTTSQHSELVTTLKQNKQYPRAPTVLGKYDEYTKLIQRMYAIGMVSFTTTPKAINGCFAVDKTDNTLRLIIDAQHANLCFHEPPHVELPSPTHLSSIYIPSNQQVVVAKMDLSNSTITLACQHGCSYTSVYLPYILGTSVTCYCSSMVTYRCVLYVLHFRWDSRMRYTLHSKSTTMCCTHRMLFHNHTMY